MNNIIYESFLTFDCHDYNYNKNKDHNENNSNHSLELKITGEILGDTVIKLLHELKLNLDYCVGIGTDGCSVMVFEIRDAIQKICKVRILRPFSNHVLNLSIYSNKI